MNVFIKKQKPLDLLKPNIKSDSSGKYAYITIKDYILIYNNTDNTCKFTQKDDQSINKDNENHIWKITYEPAPNISI